MFDIHYTLLDVMILERHKELLKISAQNQLLQASGIFGKQKAAFYCRVLDWIGRRLVALGAFLQTRDGKAIPNSSLTIAKLCD